MHLEPFTLHAPYSLHLFSWCLENSYSSFKIQFKSYPLSCFLISPGKASCSSSASFVLHILVVFAPFFYWDHLLVCLAFLQNTVNSLWAGIIHLFIPSTYQHTCYVPETWEPLSAYFWTFPYSISWEFVPDSYSDTLTDTTMATWRQHTANCWGFSSSSVSPCHWVPKSFIFLQMH